MICIAFEAPDKTIFGQNFLKDIDRIMLSLQDIPHLDSTLIATQLEEFRRSGLGYKKRRWLRFDNETQLIQSKEHILEDSTLLGAFISRDQSYVFNYIFIDPEIFDTDARDVFTQTLVSRLDASGLSYKLTGIPYIRSIYISKINFELIVFTGISTFLILLVLFFMYRNFWGVIIPTLCVVASLLWILGIMASFGEPINLISNLLIPIIFVVGMADVIHLMTNYISNLDAGYEKPKALRLSLRDIGFAIFLTSLTTSIGFISLMVSKVPPIRSFGLYAAIGVILAYVITIGVLPAGLLWLSPERLRKSKAVANMPFWDRFLRWTYTFTRKYPKRILGFTGALIISCLVLINYIPTNAHLIEELRESDPLIQDMRFFEKNGFGIRPFEIGVHTKGDWKMTDREVLMQLQSMEHFLAQQIDCSPFFSLSTAIEQANYTYKFSRKRHKKIPNTQSEIDDLLDIISINGGDQLLAKLVAEDLKSGRISTRVPDLGMDRFEEVYKDLHQFYLAECDSDMFEYRITGHAFLTEHNLGYLRSSLLASLALAFVIIGIIMGFLFKSWRILFISMVPNTIPLVMSGGVMGLAGITLSASTAIVFVVAFGIAVDDTIHFLTRFRLERKQGRDLDTAIHNTLLGTGKAMILTSLILMAGFGILMLSSFGGTLYTGLFTALTILFALLSNFFLLPILLRMFASKEEAPALPKS